MQTMKFMGLVYYAVHKLLFSLWKKKEKKKRKTWSNGNEGANMGSPSPPPQESYEIDN